MVLDDLIYHAQRHTHTHARTHALTLLSLCIPRDSRRRQAEHRQAREDRAALSASLQEKVDLMADLSVRLEAEEEKNRSLAEFKRTHNSNLALLRKQLKQEQVGFAAAPLLLWLLLMLFSLFGRLFLKKN